MFVRALHDCDRLLILIGSAYRARNIKNPFSYEERKALIEANLGACDQAQGTDYLSRVILQPLEDQMYDESRWIATVKRLVTQACLPGEMPVLVGHHKDASTYYLAHFTDWPRIEYPNILEINATAIRVAWFTKQLDALPANWLPKMTENFLMRFEQDAEFARLQEEYQFIQNYKKEWSQTPYPMIYVTTDAVVICQAHILLIRRGHCPGKGLWALPGGFLEVDEWVAKGILRELKEETSIAVSEVELHAALKQTRVFDHPSRSQVGRVITHAGLIELGERPLPAIKAADDAKQAAWVPLAAFKGFKTQMHDDHYLIAKHLLGLND